MDSQLADKMEVMWGKLQVTSTVESWEIESVSELVDLMDVLKDSQKDTDLADVREQLLVQISEIVQVAWMAPKLDERLVEQWEILLVGSSASHLETEMV